MGGSVRDKGAAYPIRLVSVVYVARRRVACVSWWQQVGVLGRERLPHQVRGLPSSALVLVNKPRAGVGLRVVRVFHVRERARAGRESGRERVRIEKRCRPGHRQVGWVHWTDRLKWLQVRLIRAGCY